MTPDSIRVPCQNSHHGSELVFLGRLGRSPVLVDQAMDDLPARNPGGHIDRLAGLVQRRPLFPRLVRPVLVVMPRVLGQDPAKVPFTVDQQVVEALAPQRPHIPLRKRIRPGRANRGLDNPHAVSGEHVVEGRRELAVAVAYQEPEPAGTVAEIHEQVAGLLGGPGAGGVGGDAQDVHAPGADLHHEQDVQAPEEHGVNVQEIARQDPGCLGGQELPPGRGCPSWRGREPGSGQYPPDRSRANAMTEAEELALDAPVPPPWVLPGQPQD